MKAELPVAVHANVAGCAWEFSWMPVGSPVQMEVDTGKNVTSGTG